MEIQHDCHMVLQTEVDWHGSPAGLPDMGDENAKGHKHGKLERHRKK
jgi:hypothetical protein